MRWINRDPIEEEGGNNLYATCGNNLLCYYDALGQKWMIERKRGNFATAMPLSPSDTFGTLANEIGLDYLDYAKWANTKDKKAKVCKKYKIPNFIAFHYGPIIPFVDDYLSVNSYWRSKNDVLVSYYRHLGFRIEEKNNVSGEFVKATLHSNGLYAFFFTGHGSKTSGISTTGQQDAVFPDRRFTRYGIHFMRINACYSAFAYSNSSYDWAQNVARAGLFVGYPLAVFRWVNHDVEVVRAGTNK